MSDDRRLERIEAKIDDILDRMSEMDISVAEQNMILKEHQRRSLANEKVAATLAKELKPILVYTEVIKIIFKIGIAVGSCGLILKLAAWFIG
jgi:lipid-binding SYLF domain-containing protein